MGGGGAAGGEDALPILLRLCVSNRRSDGGGVNKLRSFKLKGALWSSVARPPLEGAELMRLSTSSSPATSLRDLRM